MIQKNNTDCYTDDWKRTEPDHVVYLPKTENGSDGYADHFVVAVTPGGALLAMWTQSAAEGTRDSRVVFSRSLDGGESWTGPRLLAGTENGRGVPAMFGFPVMSPGGRIYCLYNKHKSIVDLGFRVTAVLGCHYSDDDGRNWTDGGVEFGYGRTSLDHPDPKVPCNCICWQGPVPDGSGRPLVTVTHVSSREVYPLSAPNAWGVRNADSQGQLMRFENIDQSPEPEDLIIRWLPGKEGQLRYPHAREPERSRGYCLFHEPSVVPLPDGRLFLQASSLSGHLIYSVSEDPDGEEWSKPLPLLYWDGGTALQHPIAPSPFYRLEDGRYLVFYHNHDGSLHGGLGPRDMRGRRPMFVAVGEFRPNGSQPIWFSEPKKLADTHGVGVGPQSLVWLAMYASLTEHKGKRIFWYPDRKHFLLGKVISDELLTDLRVPD